MSGGKPDKPPTKQSIYEAISGTNGALSWAREHVLNNDWGMALVQVEAAEITLALAKVRIKAREEAGL